MLADLGHLHVQEEEEKRLVLEGELLRPPIVGEEGFFKAAILGNEGFFRAARVGDETGQEPGRCLRVTPGSPSKRIAISRDERTLLECILYLELLRFPSLTGYQLKMTLRVNFMHFILLTRCVGRWCHWRRGMLETRVPLI